MKFIMMACIQDFDIWFPSPTGVTNYEYVNLTIGKMGVGFRPQQGLLIMNCASNSKHKGKGEKRFPSPTGVTNYETYL